jgi:hypothetical protein
MAWWRLHMAAKTVAIFYNKNKVCIDGVFINLWLLYFMHTGMSQLKIIIFLVEQAYPEILVWIYRSSCNSCI